MSYPTGNKLRFAQIVQQEASSFFTSYLRLKQLNETYLARKWNSGANDAIVDADLTGGSINLGISAAQLESYISTLFSRINNVMTNQTVTTAVDGTAITDAIRSDM
jgi:hypothetical protein